jgi:hypothetical protein
MGKDVSGTGSQPPWHQGWQRRMRQPVKRRAAKRAVALQRLQGIGRTGGFEAAGVAQPGLEQQAVSRAPQPSAPVAASCSRRFKPVCRTAGWPCQPAAPGEQFGRVRCSLPCASNADRAETNSPTGANPCAQTHQPLAPGRAAACRSKAPRIWRFSSAACHGTAGMALGYDADPARRSLVARYCRVIHKHGDKSDARLLWITSSAPATWPAANEW